MKPFHARLCVLLLGLWSAASAWAQPVRDAVQVRGWLQPDTVAAGDTARLNLSFKVDAGYHVNAIPPLTLQMPQKTPLHLLKDRFEPDSTRMGAVSRAGYRVLDVTRPLVFPAVVPERAATGVHKSAVQITYYFCSDKEGWCSFKTVEIPLRFVVRRK